MTYPTSHTGGFELTFDTRYCSDKHYPHLPFNEVYKIVKAIRGKLIDTCIFDSFVGGGDSYELLIEGMEE